MADRPQSRSTASKVLHRIRSWGRGHVFVPKDLLDLGSRGAIDVALHRLQRDGHVRRLCRGVYDYPRHHSRFGILSPSIDDVAAAIGRRTGSRIARSGAWAANALGLSTQVPARPVYLTDGPSRTIEVGNYAIRFVHASPSKLAGTGTLAGVVLRALRFLTQDGVTEACVRRLRSTLTAKDRAALERLSPNAPGWMRPILASIVQRQTPAAA